MIIKGKSEQESRVYVEGSILYKENSMRGDGEFVTWGWAKLVKMSW